MNTALKSQREALINPVPKPLILSQAPLQTPRHPKQTSGLQVSESHLFSRPGT